MINNANCGPKFKYPASNELLFYEIVDTNPTLKCIT